MKRLALLIAAIALICAPASAQNMLGRLKERAKNAVENNIGNKIEQGVNDIFNGKKKEKGEKEEKSNKKAKDDNYTDEEIEKGPQDTEAVYEQSDFVPGTVVFFEDDLQAEQMGEFPSKWDLIDGSTDVASMKGKKCIHFEPSTRIEPLMTNQSSYLPDFFTIECDFWMNDPKTELDNCYEFEFNDSSDGNVFEVRIGESYDKLEVTCTYRSVAGDWRDSGGGQTWELKKNDWSHFALSFNKRAIKIYINGKRVINIPNSQAADRVKIHQADWGGF
ncbi:MAG: hypothetical protein J5699_05130, partial [Bacteroidales bacterium]|nr:hypothetical protein [Bacteroidales bacterium]